MRYWSSVTHLQFTTVFTYQLLVTFISVWQEVNCWSSQFSAAFQWSSGWPSYLPQKGGQLAAFPDRIYLTYSGERFTTRLVRHHLWVGSRGTWCPSCWGSRWTGFLHRRSTFSLTSGVSRTSRAAACRVWGNENLPQENLWQVIWKIYITKPVLLSRVDRMKKAELEKAKAEQEVCTLRLYLLFLVKYVEPCIFYSNLQALMI